MSAEVKIEGAYACYNCGQAVPAAFCGQCGQKRIHQRLSVHDLWHDLIHALVHADKSVFRFSWLILTKPGYVAKDYLAGRRKMYFNPLQFTLLATALNVFLMTQTGIMEEMFKAQAELMHVNGLPQSSPEQQKFGLWIQKALVQYMSVFTLLIMPFFVIATGWLFKSRKLFFAERYFVCLIAFNSSTVLQILLLPIVYLLVIMGHPGLVNLMALSIVISFTLCLRQLFKLPWLESLAYTLAINILGYVLMIVLLIPIGIITGVVIALVTHK